MQLYKEKLSIAGVKIAVESEYKFQFSDRCLPFVSEVDNEDVVFRIHDMKDFDLDDYEIESESLKSRIYIKNGERIKVKYSDEKKSEIMWYMTEKDVYPSIYDIFLVDKKVLDRINPLVFVDLSEFFIRYNAMILHSSFIKYKNHGIVFSAPSQTGKSTQAELWKKYYNAKIVNGDRTIIRCEDRYYGYGSPYAGSSLIYENEKVELLSIIVIRQAKENRIRKMGLKEAYITILSEMSVPPGRKDVIEKQSKWLLELLSHVQVYMLECLPDKGAADVLYNEIREKIDG